MTGKIVRSPRAPSASLEEAVKNAVKLYSANGKHSIPADVAAKTLGYSGSNNGSAARMLASLKNFGLLVSNNKGDVAVSADVEAFEYAPDEEHRVSLLTQWLRAPKVYNELLDEYSDRLPSDQVIKYRLIKMGFLPSAAEEFLKNFRTSVNYANYYSKRGEVVSRSDAPASSDMLDSTATPPKMPPPPLPLPHAEPPIGISSPPSLSVELQPPPMLASTPPTGREITSTEMSDRIPVRLSGGRRAWIEVPMPLYEADKAILKQQIDLILTDD